MNKPIHAATGPDSSEDLLLMNSADAMHYTLEIAGVGARSYAFVIDWHIRLLIALVWIYATGVIFFGDNGMQGLFSEDDADTAAAWIVFLPAALVYFLYHPVLETLMRGSTPGKRMAGVRLVTLEGHTTSIGNILVRNIFRIVDSIPGVYTVGLIVALITRNHVRIGDLAAGTVLVYDKTQQKLDPADIAAQTANSGMNSEQLDLLHELLDRWPQLEKDQRVRLGGRFLQQIGDESHSDDAAAIRTRLLQLAGRKK
jgi:uncharacterized RDD family membrane protein YckC